MVGEKLRQDTNNQLMCKYISLGQLKTTVYGNRHASGADIHILTTLKNVTFSH